MAEKRKLADSDVVTAPSYRKGAPEKILGEFKTSKSAFGGISAVFTNCDGSAISVTTPWCDLAFDASPWDEAKQLKKDPTKPLDPKRKADKWALQMKVREQLFIDYLNDLKSAIARCIYDARNDIWSDGSKKALKSADAFDAMFEAMIKWSESDGCFVFKPDVKAAVGSDDIPTPIEDIESGAAVQVTKLGKGTQMCASIGFNSAYINKSVKVYATPINFYVRNIVAPVVRDPSKVKPELDD